MASKLVKNIPSLKKKNYTQWKTKITGYLLEKGLIEFIDEEFFESPNSTAEEYKIQKMKRGQTVGIMLQYMGQLNNTQFLDASNH